MIGRKILNVIIIIIAMTAALIGMSLTTIAASSNESTTISISGYIATDFASNNKSINAGFKVSLADSEINTITDSLGYFKIEGLQKENRTYDLIITRPGYLTRSIKNVSGSVESYISTVEKPINLWAGDIPVGGVTDNKINMIDVFQIAGAFNSVHGDGNYNEKVNFNMDSVINIEDIIILAKHFGSTPTDYDDIQVLTPNPTSTPVQTNTLTPTPTPIVSPTDVDSLGIKEVVDVNLKLIRVNLIKDYDSIKDTITVYKTSDISESIAQSVKSVTGNSKQILVIANGLFESNVNYTIKLTRDSKDFYEIFRVATDTSIPQVLKAEAIGNKKIRITFSEPIQNANTFFGNLYNYKIDDYSVSGSWFDIVQGDTNTTKQLAKKVGSTTNDDIVLSDDLTSVEFVLNKPLSAGEHTISIIKTGTNIKDYAGYEVPLTSTKFTVAVSLTITEAVKLTINSKSEIAIEFSAPISAPYTSYVYWNTDGFDTNNYKISNAALKTTDTKYTFSFTTNVIPTGKVYFFVKGAIDAYGNFIPTKKFEIEVV